MRYNEVKNCWSRILKVQLRFIAAHKLYLLTVSGLCPGPAKARASAAHETDIASYNYARPPAGINSRLISQCHNSRLKQCDCFSFVLVPHRRQWRHFAFLTHELKLRLEQQLLMFIKHSNWYEAENVLWDGVLPQRQIPDWTARIGHLLLNPRLPL